MEHLSTLLRPIRQSLLKFFNIEAKGHALYKSAAIGTFIVLLTGCAQSTPDLPGAVLREETVALPTGAPTLAPSPVNTRVMPVEALTPEPTPTITPLPDEARGLVVEAIDGDTVAIVLEGDSPSQAYVVRYIGIDAPPIDDPWGAVAQETNRQMTNLKVVRLVKDETNFDDEGRLLRYVYIGDEMMSTFMAEQGLARADSIEPNTRFQNEIEAAESTARTSRLGLWGPSPTATTARQPVITPIIESDTPEPEPATPDATTTGTVTVEPEETGESEPEAATATPTGETEETVTVTPTPDSTPTVEETPTPTSTGDEADENSDLQGPQ